MKTNCWLITVPLLAACSGSGTTSELFGSGGGANDGGPNATPGELTPPTELLSGSATLLGVTGDNRTVFRLDDSLQVVELKKDAKPETILAGSSNVIIEHQAVFTWTDVDWTTNLGQLAIWTPSGGSHPVGTSLYAEAMIAASPDGQSVLYVQNVTPTTVDLVVAPADFASPQVLVTSVGRGSETTCAPSFGFSGEWLFVGWCTLGSRAGKIERYAKTSGTWAPTTVASDALPNWSTDANAERVFYQSSEYQGFYNENGQSYLVDTGIGEGLMLPDGSAVLYNVGDQLRKSTLPDVNPFPIVTKNYAQRVEFTPSFDRVLYSTEVNYDNGTRRDLLITSTEGFNPTPTVLVDEPVASIARSAFTKDGKYLFYLTNVTPAGTKLTIRSVEGEVTRTLPDVVDVAAAYGSTIVFSDAPSEPDKWPVLATLKTLDVSSDAEPQVLGQKIVDGKTFQLSSDGKLVVYVRAAAGEGTTDSLVFQSVP